MDEWCVHEVYDEPAGRGLGRRSPRGGDDTMATSPVAVPEQPLKFRLGVSNKIDNHWRRSGIWATRRARRLGGLGLGRAPRPERWRDKEDAFIQGPKGVACSHPVTHTQASMMPWCLAYRIVYPTCLQQVTEGEVSALFLLYLFFLKKNSHLTSWLRLDDVPAGWVVAWYLKCSDTARSFIWDKRIDRQLIVVFVLSGRLEENHASSERVVFSWEDSFSHHVMIIKQGLF
jgi:hypothetical protein